MINQYFYYNDVFFLKFDNSLFVKFNFVNLKNNYKNIESFSLRFKYLKLKNISIDDKTCIWDFKNYCDLAWALRIIYNDSFYIDYTKKFQITYGVDSSISHYKICSIEFKWFDDELHIVYEKKDTFFLALLLEIYKSLLDSPDFVFSENSIKIFTNKNKSKKFNALDKFFFENNEFILYFSEIPLSSIVCEFDNKKILKDFS